MTRDTRLRAASIALALIGAAIAAYLSFSRATETALICPTSGCGKVQHSAYAELAGVPVAYLGVAGYVLILATALSGRRPAALAATVFAVVGAAFALYLLVVQVAVVDAVCVWCLSSDAVLLALVVVSVMRTSRAGGGAGVAASP